MCATVARSLVAVPRAIVVLEPDPSHESAKATKPEGMPPWKSSRKGRGVSGSARTMLDCHTADNTSASSKRKDNACLESERYNMLQPPPVSRHGIKIPRDGD